MKLFLYRLYIKLNNFICSLFKADDIRNNKTRRNYNTVTIIPATFIKEKANLYHYDPSFKPPWIDIFEAGFTAPEIWYINFDKAFLISKGLLLNDAKIIFLESAFFQREYLNKLRAAPLLLKNIFVKPQKKLSCIIPLMNQLSNNYYHWTAEHLTRIALLLKHDSSFRDNYTILINETAAPFVEDSLYYILQWPRAKIKRFGAKEIAEVSNCVQISYSCLRNASTSNYYAYPPCIFKTLNELAFKNITETNENLPHCFIISRKNSNFRNLVNEDELLARLSAFGLQSVQVEKMDFAMQVRLFQQAKIIIAPHGAGLTNLTYCNKNTVVIELYPVGRNFNQTSSFHQISKAIGLRHHILMITSANENEDMWLDEIQINKVIEIYRMYELDL